MLTKEKPRLYFQSPVIGSNSVFSTGAIADFLAEHLDRYGDSRQDILKAIDYAYGGTNGKGGFVLLAHDRRQILGAVVMNRTGMEGYIPENILVYIAVHRAYRGAGIGKLLMGKAIRKAKGDIALHVEKDNPAFYLYEHIGFTNKYLEMRLHRK